MDKVFQAGYWENENRLLEVIFGLMLEFLSTENLSKTYLMSKKSYEISEEFIREIEETALSENLKSITSIYKRQMYVSVITYLELMMKEFITCFFSTDSMSMYQFLESKTTGGKIQKGQVSLKKITNATSKESLIEELALDATSTLMSGKFSSQLKSLEKILKEELPINTKSKLQNILNLRNEIVHEHSKPNITDEDVYDAFKLFHDFIYFLATTGKNKNIKINWKLPYH